MKLILKFIACTAIVLFLAMEARYFFASEEERVQWCIEDMVSGFNAARLRPATGGLHRTWKIPDRNIDRGQLQNGLRSAFFTEKDPETRAFALSAAIVPESWDLNIREDTATVSFTLEFTRQEGDTAASEWVVRTQNELVNDDDQGWCLVETQFESLSGAMLGQRP